MPASDGGSRDAAPAAGPCGTASPGPDEIWVAERDEVGSGTQSDPFSDLQKAIDAAGEGATIHIAPGRYQASARSYTDPTVGNCGEGDFRQDLSATVGFHVDCKSITLQGAGRNQTTLVTHAGYGVLFEQAGASRLLDLGITGGVRDADGRATNGAVVVRHTELEVAGVDLFDNDGLYQGEPDPVVGIAGLVGREGAVLAVHDLRVQNSSWDGIALYSGDPEIDGSRPRATLEDIEVGCTKERSDCIAKSGRGVALGATCGAESKIVRAEVYGYWKGISSFAGSSVRIENSQIRDSITWGLAVGKDASMEVHNSVISNNGEAGVAVTASNASARYINNLIIGNGHRSVEQVLPRSGFWSIVEEGDFELAYNAFWNNAVDSCAGGSAGEEPCSELPIPEDSKTQEPKVDASFRPQPDSPLIDSGHPDILDKDGSRSDIGLFGGPGAQL